MKRILVIILILQVIHYTSQSQDSIAFKVLFKPKSTYTETFKQKSHTETIYKGDQTFFDTLKSRGIANPTISDLESEMLSITKTGKVIDRKFPFVLEIAKATSSDGENLIPAGTVFFGKVAVGIYPPTLDSVSSNGQTKEFKNRLMQTMENVFSLPFPDKKLKVGDEFSRKIPFNIPVEDVIVPMTITTKYKLNKISNDSALFDITQVYTILTDSSEHITKATGEGKGNIIYDIKNNFYLLYYINSSLDIQYSVDNFSFAIKSNSNFIQTIKITTK